MFLLAWGTGCVVGLLLLAAKPWMPDVAGIVQLVYVRANMIASGKMFVANMLPTSMINMFDWNPLFHVIDQGRGFIFVNYFPHRTNWEYPLYFVLVALVLGFMAEAYTRKHVSASWGAGR
jgi:ABC-type polysaccharide/polyol phosphate export permease